MSILVVSSDDDAARALCSALKRSGQSVHWEREVASARAVLGQSQTLVLVADSGVEGHDVFIRELWAEKPWARVYIMADPAAPLGRAIAPLIQKPFDAAELAALLARDDELARLERSRLSIQEQADHLGQLVEASFEAIIGLSPSGNVTSWNTGAEATYGFKGSEIIGRSIDCLEVDPEAARERIRTPTRGIVEVTRRRADGSEVLVLLSLSPIVREGVTAGFAEVSLDVTARRKLEREFEHSERLASIGRLAASMAHEINNPLAVIRASMPHLAEAVAKLDDLELAESVRDMELASERIQSFVQHVTSFARHHRVQLTDAPIGDSVLMAIRMVRPRANDRGVTITVEPGANPLVPHDPPRVGQAIMNLVSNAVDAAAEGGKRVVVRTIVEPGTALIEVDDDGPGVAPEIKDRLFEPFATTKPAGQGTGLGLTITQQILQDHGGTLELVALPVGTRARMILPNLDAREHRIIVADDDSAIRRALATDLRRAGFTVRTARSLADALELFDERPITAFLTDTRLPDAQGAEIVAAVRAKSPATRIVVISASSAAADAGADLMVGKPWDRHGLINAIRRLCIAV